MKNHALLIEVDSIRHSFAILKAIVQKYEKCKIFYLGENTLSVFNTEYVVGTLELYMDDIEFKINDKDTSEKDRQEFKQIKEEINRICTNISIINSEYTFFTQERLAVDVVEIKQLNDQALAILRFIAFDTFFGDELFLIAPINTPMGKAMKYYIKDFYYAGQEAINDTNENFGKTRIKDIIQAIKSLSNNLEFMYLTQLWGTDNRTALFSCADKEIFEYIKNLPENNQLLFNRPYNFYYKPVVDYRDEILLNACPCDGVYIGSYSKQ